ncbi:MAG: 3-phosphoshikimate 1-carboxyvinyltransferase [Paramuribaculum sp.]|nr:3-phosphoshikimate 1-carboxyvinyltransferase [Paramuribaculum sp.]
MNYRIYPPDGILETSVTVPLSKSESNRALIINALGGYGTDLTVARCSDTEAVQKALASTEAGEINVGNAGTAMRFLTAYFAMQEGRVVTLTGDDRMCKRPIGPLVTALRACGASIAYMGEEGFPPLRITGRLLEGGEVSVDSSMSSQFVSALLMIAPYMRCGLQLSLGDAVVSKPYMDLTVALMLKAGAEVDSEDGIITVKAGGYDKPVTRVGADWSAAAFWLEMVAVSSGFVTLRGLDKKSVQGDRAAMNLFGQLGVSCSDEPENDEDIELCGNPDVAPRLTLDMSDTPDIVQAAAVACALTGVPFMFTGVSTLRIKETDRIEALRGELFKLGIEIEAGTDYIAWGGRRMPIAEMPEFDTYGDHRMAMAFAPVALYIPGVVIRDVDVVNKSYPDYWEHLRQAGFVTEDADTYTEEGEDS